MKKLHLKKENNVKNESKLTVAEVIVNVAKKELKNFIVHQIPMLYKAFGWAEPNFAEEEEYVIPTGDLICAPYINVEVDNSYLDVNERTYEDVEIAEVRLTLDENVFLTNERGDEWGWDEVTVDELAAVAKILERTYVDKLTKK